MALIRALWLQRCGENVLQHVAGLCAGGAVWQRLVSPAPPPLSALLLGGWLKTHLRGWR
jgi:hypothetical protein